MRQIDFPHLRHSVSHAPRSTLVHVNHNFAQDGAESLVKPQVFSLNPFFPDENQDYTQE